MRDPLDSYDTEPSKSSKCSKSLHFEVHRTCSPRMNADSTKSDRGWEKRDEKSGFRRSDWTILKAFHQFWFWKSAGISCSRRIKEFKKRILNRTKEKVPLREKQKLKWLDNFWNVHSYQAWVYFVRFLSRTVLSCNLSRFRICWGPKQNRSDISRDYFGPQRNSIKQN